MRPLATIIADSLAWYGEDEHGARVHDLLGTRCDPYINTVLAGAQYDFHCHSNLVRAVAPFGLAEADVHDVINIFQVTGLDDKGRYFMNPSPAQRGDSLEFLAEQDLLMALSMCFFFLKLFFLLFRFSSSSSSFSLHSIHILLLLLTSANHVLCAGTCPGGDLSAWGFGSASEQEMIKCCRPLHVQVYKLQDQNLLQAVGWKPSTVSGYKGMHGVFSPMGEPSQRK